MCCWLCQFQSSNRSSYIMCRWRWQRFLQGEFKTSVNFLKKSYNFLLIWNGTFSGRFRWSSDDPDGSSSLFSRRCIIWCRMRWSWFSRGLHEGCWILRMDFTCHQVTTLKLSYFLMHYQTQTFIKSTWHSLYVELFSYVIYYRISFCYKIDLI